MPNDGYLDKSVHWKVRTGQIGFAEPTHDEVAATIREVGLATHVGQKLGAGKEADVYLAFDGHRPLAVKVYRQYRTSHRGGRPVKLETMGQLAVREFELLGYAWQGGAPVPEPYRRVENMFSMQYVGSPERIAPTLQHAHLDDPATFLRATGEAVIRLAEAGLVHSDLSPFNILVYDGRPWIIDLAAGLRIDRLGSPPWVRLQEATAALARGLASLARYFRRYDLDLDVAGLLAESRSRFALYRVE